MSVADDVPRRISVVEDEPDLVASLQRGLTRRGHEVTVISPSTPNLEDTVAAIMSVSDGALCDHHLQGGLDVDFTGAELVAELTRRSFPAVLFTGVLPAQRYAIRRNMEQIPSFLHRDAEGGLGPDRVLHALSDSVREVVHHDPPPHRKARRTFVTVTASRRSGTESLVSLVVSGWPGLDPIEVPADLLAEPWSHAPRDAEGKTFVAWVNIGESDEDRLFFTDIADQPVETDRFIGMVDE